jgi:hypothetical protein
MKEPPPASLLWPVFAVLGILMAMTAAMVIFGSMYASTELAKAMIDGRIISRGIVLFLIVPVIAILTIQDKITGEAAVAALSAIAGYILGGTTAGS